MKFTLLKFLALLLLFSFSPKFTVMSHAQEDVSIQLPWHHQFQFAGYYMAKEKGFYRKAGLNVEIRDVGQGTDTVEEVVLGRATFGVSGSGLLVERSLGKPVVAVAAIFQQSPTIFLTLEKAGIREPADLAGKKVMLSPGFTSLSLIALLHQEKILNKVERIPTSFDYHSLLNGETDVFNAYSTNEPALLETQGFLTHTINPADYGIQFYGDTLFTTETIIQDNPEMVEGFRIATIEGWAYALDHVDETINVLQTKYNVKKSVELLKDEAAETTKIVAPDLVNIGSMGMSRWAQITHHLIAIGSVPPTFKIDDNFLYSPPEKINWGKLTPWLIGATVVFAFLIVFLAILGKAHRKLLIAQREISSREQKYRLVINHQKDVLLLHKAIPEGFSNFIEVNDAAVKFYGYSREELLERGLRDVVDPEKLEEHIRSGGPDRLIERGEFFRESIHINKAGEKISVESSATIVELDGEKYILSMIHDITERKQAEQKNKAYQTQLITILNSIDANVYVADMTTFEILFMNGSMIADFGQDLTGQICWKSFRGESEPCKFCSNHLLIDENGKSTGVHVWSGQHPINGKYYIYHDRVIQWDDERTVRLQISTDISEIKAMEQQLTQKHKMEAVGYMAGGMAHNFNNNLAIILGNIELSLRKSPSNSEIIHLLENAKTAVKSSRDLVHKIITYSRKGIQHKTSIHLADVIDGTMALLRSTLPSTINLQQEINPESCSNVIYADSSQIQETLINLCNNALHAMNEKGDLRILLNSVDLSDKDIPAQYEATPGSYAKLSIQDNGCGMPTELLDKIFDPFFTTKEDHEGAGMGLATVQGIVAQNNGIIKVNSIPDQGTVFDLYFPIIDQIVTTPETPNADMAKGTERILFIDDDEMLANLGEMLLSEMGYQVSTMTESPEALKLFSANPYSFDLVITDQTMPDLTGIELIQEIKKIRSDIPTIICTGFSSQVDEHSAKERGASAFLMKPLDMPELMQAVRSVLDGK